MMTAHLHAEIAELKAQNARLSATVAELKARLARYETVTPPEPTPPTMPSHEGDADPFAEASPAVDAEGEDTTESTGPSAPTAAERR